MATALLNTIMSMTIIFLVLIFISFVISLLKYTSKFRRKSVPKAQEIKPRERIMPAKVPAPIIVKKEEKDDTELVAVITAAIAAYRSTIGEVPADGLVVRSIKRRGFANNYCMK